MATVISIHRVRRRDAPAEALDAAVFATDVGLEGDWRSRRGRRRQITLIEGEALDGVAVALGLPSVSPGASRRQVVVRDIALNDTVGQRLRVGPLLVQVDERCDPCPNMEVKIGRGAQPAMQGRGGVCGRIIEGGTLRRGDAITLVQWGSPMATQQFERLSAVDRLFNRLFGFFVGLGLGLSHNYLLEVRGRKSGQVYTTPVDVLSLHGRRFLVAPRGVTQWVRNAQASGHVNLRKGGRSEELRVRAIPDHEKPELLKAYLDRFKLTVQRFFPVKAGAPLEEFVPLVGRYPVFELLPPA